MKTKNFGPHRRAGVWLQGVTLLVGAALSGCQSPYQALQGLSTQHAGQVEILPTQPFPLALGTPLKRPATSRIRIYLEGDGHAWATPTQPSLDPSPRHLLVAQLALSDPTPSIYLARPCQFIKARGCAPELWTDRRFSEEVVASLDQALDLIKARLGNRDFELVGYSGGAALALLLAARRDDISLVQTLAGNLSPRLWVSMHRLSTLTGSLEPLDYRARLTQVPQRHLVGADDRIVLPRLLQQYLDALGEPVCLESAMLANVTHNDGWSESWSAWRDQPIDCLTR